MNFQSHTFSHSQAVDLQYLLYLPDDYEKSEHDFPLILFLHGKGQRGAILDDVKEQGLPQNIEAGENYPFIVIAPQCPINADWEHFLPNLNAILQATINSHRVDTSRVYLTGLSMGGSGTWSLATEYPDQFAAIIPICGVYNHWLDFPERLENIKDTPVWCFHGDADSVVPLAHSQAMIDGLISYGNTPKFTIYEGVDHDSWTQTYDNPEIYEWLLSHRLNVDK
jgi:predicted peptidase